MKLTNKPLAFLYGPLILMALTSCGGGGNGNRVSATVSGLSTGDSVVLQVNSAGDMTVSSNTSVMFAASLGNGAAYAVSVLTQPAHETCAVTNGTGSIAAGGGNVSNVTVVCSANESIVGTVTGLPTTATTLQLANGSVRLQVTSNGRFAFPGVLPASTAYNVTVGTQPAGRTCTVTNGTGTTTAGAATAIVVTCV